MRKYALSAAILATVFLTSCEEIGPVINFDPVISDPSDTTYIVTPVPAAQARNVYVEEFTGVSCPNCPAGHTFIKSLKADHGDRVIAVGMYKYDMGLTDPVNDGINVLTVDDFRNPIANEIDGAIYNGGANSLPIAGIDRIKHNNVLLLDRALWVSTVEARMTVATPLNLEVTSTYNGSDSMLKVKITATFTSQVSEKVSLTVGVIQDSIIDYQEKGSLIIPDYQHDHVLRGTITGNVNGLELPFSDFYEAGRVFVRTINVKLAEKLREQSSFLKSNFIKPEHCKVFVVAHHTVNSKEVLQAAEVDMK